VEANKSDPRKLWQLVDDLLGGGRTPANSAVDIEIFNRFWATVCKTVRPMLSVRCPVCLSVCDVRALWPNGWTDRDETKVLVSLMKLGMQIGLGPGHIVLDGDQAPHGKGHSSPPPQFSAHLLWHGRGSPISATAELLIIRLPVECCVEVT